MKLLHLILMATLPLFAIAQDCTLPTNAEGKYEFEKVVSMEKHSKSSLYDQALISMVDLFDYPDEVIRLKDKETGILALEIPIFISLKKFKHHQFNFKVQMEFKDDRYKITAHHLSHSYTIGIEMVEQANCFCMADISQNQCDCRGCALSKQHWVDARCEAAIALENKLARIQQKIAAQDSNW